MLIPDETWFSSHLRHDWSSARRDMGSTGSYGAKEKADGGAGLGFDVVALLQALPDHERMRESNQGTHDQLRRLARIDRLEFPGVHAVAQDQFHHPVHRLLMPPHPIPPFLDCTNHELINAVRGH